MTGDSYPVEGGTVVIHPVEHASFVMTAPGLVIYADPVGGAAAYAGLPPPALILITHEHQDHFDPDTLAGLAGENARLLTNPAVHGMLPADLQARATAIANGESTTADAITIDAIPAYNTTPDRLQYHPQGRDNGYVLTDRRAARLHRRRHRGHPRDAGADRHRHRLPADEPALHHGRSSQAAARGRRLRPGRRSTPTTTASSDLARRSPGLADEAALRDRSGV